MAQPTQTFGPWLKQKLVEAGEISPDAQGVNLDPKVRDAYLRMWQNESKVSNFQPTAVAVTNPVNTNQVIPVLTTSPNSVQPLPQPRVTYKPDKEGNLLAIDGTTANYVTNNTGERVKVDPKSNRLDDLMTVLGDNGARPEESGGGIGSWLASWMPGSGKPVPAATPAPSPAMQQTAEPAVPTGTNASAPVALTTPEEIRAAFQAGRISEADAVRMLRGGR